MAGKAIKPKKACCKSGPRCKRCPVVLKRLRDEGLAKRKGDGTYRLKSGATKKAVKAARAR